MQSDYKQIYKELSQETSVSEQLYKDLGNFIFQETYNMLRSPTSLIIKLKGIGNWHLRKKRMDIVVSEYPDRGLVKTRDEFESDLSFQEYLDKKKQYDIFVARLKEYDEYLKMKKEIRAIRNETQTLLQPVDRSSERFKSGKD